MKTYTLTESEKLKAALKKAVEVIKQWHGDEVFDIYYNHAPEMKLIREALLPTEEVGIKEDEKGEMSSFLNSEGEDDYGLYEEDAKNDVKIIYETYKTMIDCPLKEHLKKWFDYVPSDNNNEGASLASHSCTIGNSIQQWISVDEELPEMGECVLVSILNDTVLKGRLMSNGWAVFFADGECLALSRRVTHWMPLPKSPTELQGDAVSDTTEADSSNAADKIKISELREKFFKECTDVIEENIGAANTIFEWFKPYLKIPSIDWEGLEQEFLLHCTKQIGWPESYQQIKDTYVNDPLHLIFWLKTKLQNYIK